VKFFLRTKVSYSLFCVSDLINHLASDRRHVSLRYRHNRACR
jgi:hypothetical protein